MEANLVDLVDAKNTKGTDNFKDQIVENGLHDTINVNEKSDVKLENIEDVKQEVPNIKTCENELNNSHSTSQYNMSNDTFTHEANEANLSYSYLCITPSTTETAAEVITIHDDSSVIIILDETQKENSMFETNQSINPSKNLNKIHPEGEKSFQDSKTNISTSDVQENDSNESSKGIESSFINTMQNKSCVEILDDDIKKRTSLNQTSSVFETAQSSEGLINPIENESRVGILDNDNEKRTSLNQNSSAFEYSLRLEESVINTTQNISCVEILDNDKKKSTSLNQTSTSAFESSHSEHPEESLISTTQNESCVEVLGSDIKKRASLNQTSAAFESSQHLENTTQNISCVEILDNDNKKRISLNQTSTSAFESSHSEHPEESLINTTQNESCVEVLDNDTKKRASVNQTSTAFESSQHLEESLTNTTQNISCVEILDKRASLNQTSAAFESSQHLQESLNNTTQNISCVEILDNDNKNRTSLNQTSTSTFGASHSEESLINTTQNESCVDVLDNDIKKRVSLNETSAPFESSQHLEDSLVNTTQNKSCVEILDNDNRKRTSLHESAFESSQQLTTYDLIDLNITYPEERSSNKVITDIQDSKEFPKKESNESAAEIDKCLVNNSSCSNIVYYQPNESLGSDNKRNTNVNEALPVLESSLKTSTNGLTDGSNDLNKTYQEEKTFLNPTNAQDSDISKEEVQDEKPFLNPSNQTFQQTTSLITKLSEDGNSQKLQSINQDEIYTTYEEQIEGRLDASESTNLLNQTFSENSIKHNRTSTLNSTETDLVMALEALNINCDEKDETFLSCQDIFEMSVKEEDFESNPNATINDFDSSVHKCNTTFELGEKKSKTSIGDEICHPENIETEEPSRVASPPNENDNGMRTSIIESSFPTNQLPSPGININENDISMRSEDVPLNESTEINKNSSSETVIQDDNELDLAVVPDVITPNKFLPKPRLSEASNDDILIDYNSLLEASPSVFDRRASMFGRQSDLKLYVNELEQRISKLQIQLCKKESIILKQQMAQNCAEKCRKFEENNGQTESELIKNLCAELEKEKTKIAQMKIAHESDVKRLNQKLSAQEAKLRDHEALTEKFKELEQNTTEVVLKLEKATSDKNKVIELLDRNDNLMAYMSTKNKELVEDKAVLEKKLFNINNAFKEVVGKYEQCKVIITGLKKNEDIYKGEINELRNVLKRHEEIYANFKKDAETKLKEANEQITTLQKFKLEAEKAKLPGKRRYK